MRQPIISAKIRKLGTSPTGTISLLLRLTQRPVTASKKVKNNRIYIKCCGLVSQKRMESPAKRRWEMLTSRPMEKPVMNPSSTIFLNIRLRTSITRRKRRGERESPCLKPLELLKNLEGEPLTGTEKRTKEIQALIQLHQRLPKPILSKIYTKHSQFTWS